MTTQVRALLACAGMAATIASARPAQAGDDAGALRYTTVFEEIVEGQARKASVAEAELVGLLLKDGVTFVDEAQSRKIRSVTTAGKLLAGMSEVSSVITALDADVIVAGVSTLTPIKNDLLGKKVFRFDATLESRAIAVDTGHVLASLTAHGDGVGYTPEQAAQNAAKKAAGELAKTLLDSVGKLKRGLSIEISVAGIPDVGAAEKVIGKIEKVPGVKKARVLQTGEITKIAVESDKTARELAVALDAARELGLRVFGYSGQAIKAEYDLTRGTKLTLALGPMKQTSGEKRHAWEGRAIGEILGTALSESGALTLSAQSVPVELPQDVKSWKKVLEQAKYAPERTVVLQVAYKTKQDKNVGGAVVDVDARLLAAASGVVVSAGQRSCSATELHTCLKEMGTEMRGSFEKQLIAKRDLFQFENGAIPGADNKGSKPLEIATFSVENIFPAQIGAYSDRPIGILSLKNTSDETLKNVVVTVNLPGFMKAPLSLPSGDIAKHASADIPIKVILDAEVLTRHDENRPAVLTAVIEYSVGEYRVSDSRSTGVVIFDRNALSWKNPESVATFITTRAEEVLRLGREFQGVVPEEKRGFPLATAIAIFRGLGARGLKYATDPISPFGADTLDYVQYPVQTLSTGRGDCDDLAVLYASLAEAVGLRTVLITTPGHVFVGVPAGVPEQSAYVLSTEASDFMTFGGELWVPVETTKLGASFNDAWRAATKEVGKWKNQPGKLEVIDVHTAWSRYPQASLTEKMELASLNASAVGPAVSAEIEALEAERAKALEAKIRTLDARILKAKGKVEEGDSLTVEKARVLTFAGKNDEARKLLEEVLQRNAHSAPALNNMGNLSMIMENAEEARGRYGEALKYAPKESQVGIRINAALAALVLGKESEFADHIVACLEAGADDAVMGLARAGYGQSDSRRGANEAGIVVRDLEVALGKAIAKAKRPVPAALKEREKASSTSDARPVARYLHWLSSVQ